MSIAPTPVAPYNVRFRLALTGLAIAWVLAGLFLLLGWRASAEDHGTAATATVTRLR